MQAAQQRELLGAWYERSHRHLGRGYHEWCDEAAIDLVAALVSGADPDEAAVRLGAARAHGGYSEIETLSDLSTLQDVVPPRLASVLVAPHLTAAVTAGHEMVGRASFPKASTFGGVDSLKRRLADLYRDAGATPRLSHALVVVDIVSPDGSAVPGVGVHVLAQQALDHFPLVDEIAWLGDARFAVLARSHPGLALGLGNLEQALRDEPDLTGLTVSTWVEPLPPSPALLPRFVRRLVGTTAGEAMAARAAAGDPVSTAEVAAAYQVERRPEPDDDVRERLRRRLVAWREAAQMVAAATAALVIAAGVSQVVGPQDGAVPSVTTFLGGRLMVPAPAAPNATLTQVAGAIEVAEQSGPEKATSETVVEVVTRRVAVTTPAPAPAPAAAPPVTVPAPPPTPPTAEPPPAPAPAPAAAAPGASEAPPAAPVAPCSGLGDKDRKKCEKQAEKDAKKAEKDAKKAEDDEDDEDDD